jgi:hypothetical protein
MRGLAGAVVATGRTVLLVALLLLLDASAQTPATFSKQLPTEQRLRLEGWWPTKPASISEFTGPRKCAGCHSRIYDSQSNTAMAQSMPSPSTMLDDGKAVSFRQGPYSYQFSKDLDGAQFVASDGKGKISVPVGWVFGSGRTGRSFLFSRNDSYYEGRLSYLVLLHGLNITPGQSTSVPSSLEKALGHRLTREQAGNCFACHATAVATPRGPDTAHMMKGVTCEACHGPGADHSSIKSIGVETDSLIFNPAHLSPSDSVDFCGSCHRTWWDTMALGFTGIMTVRFPVYRLERSRCWGTGDRRVTCVACHDPHQELVHDAAYYDSRCLSCHVNGEGAKPTADHPGMACPKNTKMCVTCHMPKYELPEFHLQFTDHQIRIVRKGEKFPG